MAERRQERRKFRRFALSCPMSVHGADGHLLAHGKTLNLSDGGAYMVVTIDALLRMGKTARLDFSVPRTTANTHLWEKFTCNAQILRHEPLVDDSHAGIAIRFEQPQELGLEV